MTDITSDPVALQAGQQVDQDATPPTSGNVIGGVPGIAQPAVQAAPSPTNAQIANQVAQQPVSQAHLHTGIFHTLLSRMNQGDQQVVRDAQGNPVSDPTTGRVQTRPMSSKQLGRSILASALAALATTEAHQPYRNGNGIWVNPSNEAVSAADQALQAGRPQTQLAQAQAQSNAQRTQQYAIYKQNVSMFAQMHQMLHAQTADQQAAAEEYKGTYDAGEAGEIPGYESALGDLTASEAEDKVKTLDPTSHMMVPNGKVVPILDPQTHQPTGRTEMHWMVLPGQSGIPITQEMIDKNPNLKGAPVGQSIPLTQWLKLVHGQAQQTLLAGMFNDLADAQNAGFPDQGFKSKNFNYPQFVRDSKATPDQLVSLGHISADRTSPDVFAKNLKAIDGTGQMDAALRNQGIKIDENAWSIKRAKALSIDKKTLTPDIAIQKIADPNTPADEKKVARDFLDEIDNREIAKQNRIEAGRERLAQSTQDRKDQNMPVYADDGNGQLILTNKFAHPEGEEMQKGDIYKDRTAIRMLNDVQTNVNRYHDAIRNNLPKINDTDRNLMRDVFALGNELNSGLSSVGVAGAHFSVPTLAAAMSADAAKKLTDDYNHMSQDGQAMMNAYLRTAAAVPAYQKAMTQIGRANKEMLDLELANVPQPYYDPKLIQSRTDAFQENVDRAKAGYPNNLPGMQVLGSSALPGTGKTFIVSRWLKANPNGDVNAAISKAKQQGYNVQ